MVKNAKIKFQNSVFSRTGGNKVYACKILFALLVCEVDYLKLSVSIFYNDNFYKKILQSFYNDKLM